MAKLQYKIIHIMPKDKFIEPFIEFVSQNFDMNEHLFIVRDFNNDVTVNNRENVIHTDCLFKTLLSVDYKKSEKIILHGLFSYLTIFLFFNKRLLSKSYWIIWGNDLYRYRFVNKNIFRKTYEYIRKSVIKRINNFIVYMDEEFEKVKEVYDVEGRHFKSFVYLSNIFKTQNIKQNDSEVITILLGNSATRTNNHFESLELLSKYKDENIKVIAPLSYGDKTYGEAVAKKGKELFDDKFVSIFELLPLSEYEKLLSRIDIVFFNHDRQQGIGNINTLIGLGKKVYLRDGTSQYEFYKRNGFYIFNLENFNLQKNDKKTILNNIHKLEQLFSEEVLKNQLQEIFDA